MGRKDGKMEERERRTGPRVLPSFRCMCVVARLDRSMAERGRTKKSEKKKGKENNPKKLKVGWWGHIQ